MKKLSLLIAFMLLVGRAPSVQATVDVTCFDDVFKRKIRKPRHEHLVFPGISGPATVQILNGDGGMCS